ncbi:MAG: hypothetical protein ACRDGR_07650, partial [bacterium]
MNKALALAAALACGVTPVVRAGQISPDLERQLQGLDGGDEVKVLVVLREQADIATLDAELRVVRAPMSERHRRVVDALREMADRTQPPILQDLTIGRDAGIRGFTPYWILNGMTVVGTVDAIRALAARSDVHMVEPDLRVALIEPVPGESRKEGPSPRGTITPG